MRVWLDDSLDPNDRANLCGETIRHQLKLAIRWNEGNGSIVFESGEPHTLVELDILQVHCFPLANIPSSLLE